MKKKQKAGVKKKEDLGMVHGATARFLIIRVKPAGAAVFAKLKCSGGDTLPQQP